MMSLALRCRIQTLPALETLAADLAKFATHTTRQGQNAPMLHLPRVFEVRSFDGQASPYAYGACPSACLRGLPVLVE